MSIEMTEAIRNIEEMIKTHQDKYNSLPKNCFNLKDIELARINTLLELKGRLALEQVK